MNRSIDLDTIAPDDPTISSLKINPKLPPKNEEELSIKANFSQKVSDILGHSSNPLSSFLIKPKILSFSERDDSEEIYLALRPHWINNLSWITISFIMLFVPLFFRYFSFLDFLPAQYHFSMILFWYLFTFIYTFEKFLGWYFNVFLITNQRVVDIDFNNLLNKHFAQADLSMIQDISSSVRGVLGTFFNYGDVLIQTAAEINQINFEKVSNPEKVIKLLKELCDLETKKQGDQQ